MKQVTTPATKVATDKTVLTAVTSKVENSTDKKNGTDPVKENTGTSEKQTTTQPGAKEQLRAQLPPAFDLESMMAFAREKHMLTVKRDRLNDTMEQLNAFQFVRKEESEDTDKNYYNGCTLTIIDDARHKWETRNPVIIEASVDFIVGKCEDRLSEIEAEIVTPYKP